MEEARLAVGESLISKAARISQASSVDRKCVYLLWRKLEDAHLLLAPCLSSPGCRTQNILQKQSMNDDGGSTQTAVFRFSRGAPRFAVENCIPGRIYLYSTAVPLSLPPFIASRVPFAQSQCSPRLILCGDTGPAPGRQIRRRAGLNLQYDI